MTDQNSFERATSLAWRNLQPGCALSTNKPLPTRGGKIMLGRAPRFDRYWHEFV